MPRSPLTVTVERCPVSGTLTVSAIVGGEYIRRRYMGHTRREAVTAFRSEVSPR